jgi:hypothetical protein
MPSCCYFQILFSSEEQKTTRSINFRALVPLNQRNHLNRSPDKTRTLLVFKPLQSILLHRTARDFALATLAHFSLLRSDKAEALKVQNRSVPQGLEPGGSGLSISRLPTLLGFLAS